MDLIKLEVSDHVATITIDRQEVLISALALQFTVR